jgi:hypothetical protein
MQGITSEKKKNQVRKVKTRTDVCKVLYSLSKSVSKALEMENKNNYRGS